MAQTKKTPARTYVDNIKNDAKRDYARAYLTYLQCGGQGPQPDTGPLQYMTAQAVRLRLSQELAEDPDP